MKPAIFDRAVQIDKTVKHFKKTIEILEAEYNVSRQMDIEEAEGKQEPVDTKALKMIDELGARIKRLEREFAEL